MPSLLNDKQPPKMWPPPVFCLLLLLILSASGWAFSSSSPPAATKVVVTGAGGYVGAQVVLELLKKGFHVVGTVRSLKQESRYDYLRDLAKQCPPGTGKLTLLEADLQVRRSACVTHTLAPPDGSLVSLPSSPSLVQVEGSYDQAVDGCHYVFHVASPVIYNSSDPVKDLVDPAVNGVKNIMKSIARNKATPSSPFRRLVLTSSLGAVFGFGSKPKNGRCFTDEDWNEVVTVSTMPYYYSKVVAERTAWELAREHGIDMVTILPAYVWGPPASPALFSTFNLQRLRGILMKEQPLWEFAFPICDVRDVAMAHVLAALSPQAKGRYLVTSEKPVTPRWFAKVVERWPQFHEAVHRQVKEDVPGTEIALESRAKLERDLQFSPRQEDTILVDTVNALLPMLQKRE